jgi:hypothetical protein
MDRKFNKSTILDLLSKPAQYEYFFKKLDKPGWFDLLQELNVFTDIPEPRLIDDGKLIQFPIWWPGRYLIKVADRIPEKVLSVIKNVKTDNCSAIDECVRAILNMPVKFLAENYLGIVELFNKWLDAKYVGRVKYDIDDLFGKFMSIECFEGAFELLSVISKSRLERQEVKFRFDVFYFKEIIKRYFPKLSEFNPITLLNIMEKRLSEAISLESGSKEGSDDSIGWRPSIEDTSQKWDFDHPRDILVDVVRDILQKILLLNPSEARKIIQKYIKDKYQVFRRIAINAIRTSKFDDLAQDLICQKDNLDDIHIHHEFFKLVEEKLSVLTATQKRAFVSAILEINEKSITKEIDEERAKKYKRFWQARRISMIQKYLNEDVDLAEFKRLLTDFRDELDKIDHPDFLSYHSSWTGPMSSLTKEQIQEMSVKQFVNWIKNNLQPPYDMMGPSPEGVSRIFQEVVRDNPIPYADGAGLFLDTKIFPAYLSGLMRGLEEAIKSDKVFNLSEIFKLVENTLKYSDEPIIDSRFDRFDIGEYSWFRGAIATFVEALVMKDSFDLSEEVMNRTQAVLQDLILKDNDPTEISEKEYGPAANNMDYVTYCINSNRGKAMCALIQHALRRARMQSPEEKKKEEGKGPFPPGKRMDRYKEFFTKRLDDERSPSVQSSYGRFLPNLCYLDQEWVMEMLLKDKLFSKRAGRQAFWEGQWQGYVGFHGVYNLLYEWLGKDYDKAVEELPQVQSKEDKGERYDYQLAKHLMIAYRRKLENIDETGKISKFFRKASVETRGHAIWFMGTAISHNLPEIDSEEWKRLKLLWEYRIKNCKDEEMGSFIKWLKDCPEKIDHIVGLIKPIVPYMYKHFNEREFLEYLSSKVSESPAVALELLNQLLHDEKAVGQLFFWNEIIRAILAKLREYRKDARIVRGVNAAVNRLGEKGQYEFQEFLINE